jgi:hypothetical protein
MVANNERSHSIGGINIQQSRNIRSLSPDLIATIKNPNSSISAHHNKGSVTQRKIVADEASHL